MSSGLGFFHRESGNGCEWCSSQSFIGGEPADIQRRDRSSFLSVVGAPNGRRERVGRP